MRGTRTAGWRRDLDRLWGAFAASELGGAVGLGAVPLVAVLALGASGPQVSLLTALSGVAGAVLAVPLGPWVEFRRKRPVMVAADLARCAALASVPVAAALGMLSLAQVGVVATVTTTGTIVFRAASTAHLKALVPAGHRLDANARFEGTAWTALAVGPPVGGALVSFVGVTASVAVDAASFLVSALGIRRLRTPEPAPPYRPAPGPGHGLGGPGWRTRAAGRWREAASGWRFVLAHPVLAPLLGNGLVFGGGILATGPLLTVLMLRDLHLTPWQYGLSLGLPCLGGVVGSRLAPALVRRAGTRRVLLVSGVLRTPWPLAFPFAPAGTPGLLLLIAGHTLLLLGAGVFNPAFVSYRMGATPDEQMARVGTAWSVAGRFGQPLFIAGGGALAAVVGLRGALAGAALVVVASCLLLPWRGGDDDAGPPQRRGAARVAASSRPRGGARIAAAARGGAGGPGRLGTGPDTAPGGGAGRGAPRGGGGGAPAPGD
jgi:hypothetical protein